MARYSTRARAGLFNIPAQATATGSGAQANITVTPSTVTVTPAEITVTPLVYTDTSGITEGDWDCATDVQVGDLVEITSAQTVGRSNVTASSLNHIAGIVVSKSTETVCAVRYTGEITLSGLTPGADYYAGDALGSLTETPATSGYVQEIGRAKDSDTLIISIHKRTILT